MSNRSLKVSTPKGSIKDLLINSARQQKHGSNNSTIDNRNSKAPQTRGFDEKEYFTVDQLEPAAPTKEVKSQVAQSYLRNNNKPINFGQEGRDTLVSVQDLQAPRTELSIDDEFMREKFA